MSVPGAPATTPAAGLVATTYAERPDLVGPAEALVDAGWPAFMSADPVEVRCWDRLAVEVPELQVVLVDPWRDVHVAVGNAVLDVVLAPGFLNHVAAMGLRLKQRLAGLKDEHGGIIEEIRGQGLMLGLKCKVPNQALLQALAAERMLTVQAGDNVVRLLPPLIVGEVEIDEACAKIEAACVALETGARVEA